MSVQANCPFDVPRRVRCTIFGTTVVAKVVSDELEADAKGPRDVLTVEHEGSRYRIDASEADAC